MKPPPLRIKIVILLGYVVVCTMLVLGDQQAEPPTPVAQELTEANYE